MRTGASETWMTKETAVPGTQHAPLLSNKRETDASSLSSPSPPLSRLIAATSALAWPKRLEKLQGQHAWNAMLRGLAATPAFDARRLGKSCWLTAGSAAEARWTPRDEYFPNQVACPCWHTHPLPPPAWPGRDHGEEESGCAPYLADRHTSKQGALCRCRSPQPLLLAHVTSLRERERHVDRMG